MRPIRNTEDGGKVTLLEAERGRPVRVVTIGDEICRAQCLRFGIGEGTLLDSSERLPLGPVLVRYCDQEICLGRKLASKILVEEARAT
jgi:Fe2+ transport system protein FeoA